MQKYLLAFIFILFSGLARSQKPGAEIDVLHYQFAIELNDENDTIRGNAEIEFRILKDTKLISFDLASQNESGKGMNVISIKENDQTLLYTHARDQLIINFSDNAKKGSTKTIKIIYKGVPIDGLIISRNKYGKRTFFGDNWPDRAHHWLPCADHPSDKAAVDFIVTAPEHYQVISNGMETEVTNLPGHIKQTRYEEKVPLPTKVMVIGVADFAVNFSGQEGCVPIYSWVYPEEREKGFYDYGLAKNILPFFIDHVGAYPYRKLANVQSKTTFGGMENAGAIFYHENSVIGDRTVEALLVHEIAHQWFGNSATETDWQHIWLSEGFATYMTHLYLENKYGPDTLLTRMKEDRKQVIAYSKLKIKPVVDTTVTGNYTQLLNANSYQKGSWVLHMLRRKLGDDIFWKGIRNYYADYAGRNANTEDFRLKMESVCGQDLKNFFQQWLYRAGQPKLEIKWNYNAAKKLITITLTQQQIDLFEFPLELKLEAVGKSTNKTVLVKDKINAIIMPVETKPSRIFSDPNVSLLFEVETKEIK
jgi:aminopeptidase N